MVTIIVGGARTSPGSRLEARGWRVGGRLEVSDTVAKTGISYLKPWVAERPTWTHKTQEHDVRCLSNQEGAKDPRTTYSTRGNFPLLV